MDKKDILKIVDHMLLTQTTTWNEIREILDDAMNYETASVCIPASYVKQVAEYVEQKKKKLKCVKSLQMRERNI